MTEEPRAYFSYLLRLWKVSGAGPPVWRASLENPHTRARKGFPDLESLFAFLEEQTGESDWHERPRTHSLI